MADSTPAPRTLTWHFPLPRTHTGVLLGNATQGLMVWGDQALHITVGRAAFWDHRGGNVFATKTTYAQLRTLLEANDEPAIKAIFAPVSKDPNTPDRPYQLGCGRLELTFPDNLRPISATLAMTAATITVTLSNGTRTETVTIRQAVDQELAWVQLPPALQGKVNIKAVPTWQFVGERLKKVGIAPPTVHAQGFTQFLPEDPALAFAYADRGSHITLATAMGATPQEDPTDAAVKRATFTDINTAAEHARQWWTAYWDDVPTLNLPDAVLQRAYDYGTYKQACLTSGQGGGVNSAGTAGIPASLQGCFMEEYQVPPWSNDYHFNINIQMIYWPALATGRLSHLQPLWDMLFSWVPQLKANAEGFFGAKDALMLPHAVDDRCRAVGQFWAGTIDHACTAWMAQMAWLQYRYSMDEKVLKETAWPLLVGAFNGYWAMLEEVEEKGEKRLRLPVSTSPEYNGSGMNAWGRNASFQLAACHFTANALVKAAGILGKAVDPRWQRVQKELPPYALAPRTPAFNLLGLLAGKADAAAHSHGEEARPGPRIALFEGKDYDVSHRHPSHLGAIYPFCTVDPADPAHAEVVRNSLWHWTRLSIGAWSGWAIPFAALIHTRAKHADAAIQLVHIWDYTFTNEGLGTLHDALFPGISIISAGDMADREIMQMDAGMGVITVVTDILVQQRGEDLHILPEIPKRWRTASFSNVRAEGAFLVSATLERGQVQQVRIKSLAGAPLSLVHHLGESWTLDGVAHSGPRLTLKSTKKDQVYVLKRA